MDLSSFHISWLALGAQSKGCVPSCFPHLCHVLAFSVSPTGAGLCSGQPAAFEVHHRQVGIRKLLQTNGASGSRLTSSTMRNGFEVFRIVRKHMNSGPLHLLLRGPLQCQFWDGGVCCTNCLTLNEMSIFQDFNRSNDWVTFQQLRQIWQGLWFPRRPLIFNWWQLALRRLPVDRTPSR